MNAISPAPITFRQILVATDFSNVTTNALNYAKAIAKRYSSHIVLVHVCPPAGHIAIPEGGWLEDSLTQRIEEKVNALEAELRAEGYTARAVTTYGAIEHEIRSFAEADGTDLIVLGTHGRRGIDRLLFGSEAEALIQHCGRPVLTVGPAAAPPKRKTWLLNEIVCAAAPEAGSAKAAAYGYRLAEDNEARFTLYYAEDPSSSPSPGNWRIFEDAFDRELPEGEARRCSIRGYFPSESSAAGIVETARKRQADLIVLGAKHAILGSTHFCHGLLPEVLLHAPCPVLTISYR